SRCFTYLSSVSRYGRNVGITGSNCLSSSREDMALSQKLSNSGQFVYIRNCILWLRNLLMPPASEPRARSSLFSSKHANSSIRSERPLQSSIDCQNLTSELLNNLAPTSVESKTMARVIADCCRQLTNTPWLRLSLPITT